MFRSGLMQEGFKSKLGDIRVVIPLVVTSGFLGLVIYGFWKSSGPLPYPPPQTVFVDCTWQGHPSAWIDVNRNGTRESEEPPLAGVTFTVEDIAACGHEIGERVMSGRDGTGELWVMLGGCPEIRFQVHAEAPSNYLASTPTRVEGEGSFSFGFYRETN